MHKRDSQDDHAVSGFWDRLKLAVEDSGLSPLERLERRVQLLERELNQLSGARSHRSPR